MLTIAHDPLGVTGRSCYAWDHGITLQDNIARHLGGGAGCTLSINGEPVDPLTDPRLDMPPQPGDTAFIVCRPEGIEAWILAASLVISVASLALARAPTIDATPVAKDSPNNRLTGQTNIARTYQAIPDAYGLRRLWPDLIQPSAVEYVDHVKFVTEWLCVSRGKGTITDIRYAETPIGDIDGASYQIFEPAATPDAYPERNSTTLTNVLETFAVPDVNGQEIRSASGVIPAIDFRIASYNKLSTFVITLTFPDESAFDILKSIAGTGTANILTYGGPIIEDPEAGFPYYEQDVAVTSFSTSGGYVTFTFTSGVDIWTDGPKTGPYWRIQPLSGSPSTSVGPFTLPIASEGIRWNIIFLRGLKSGAQIRAEWWKIDSGGAEISGTRQTLDRTYSDDTFDQRYFTTTIYPTAGFGRYRIQFERLNAENAAGTDVAKLETVYAVRRYATKVLPGVTVIRVTTKATEEATGFSDRKFNLRWQRHVRTLTADTLSTSRNFARIMAHVWTLAGGSMTELDTTALQAINTALGETSALLRFDGSFDDADQSLGERLQRIAYHARCKVWRDGTKWTVTRDQARSVYEVQLDYRNLAADGDSSISYAAHLPASNDGVEVEYVDETTQAKKAYVRLSIASGSVVTGTSANPARFKLPGCATTSQAENRAQLEARRLLYQRTTVRDTALADGGQTGLDSLVKWIDPNDFAGEDGLQAGEVMTIAGSVITTSEPIDWKSASSGRMLFTGTDGRALGSPVVVTPAAGGAVQLASVPGGLFVRDDDRQVGSRYSFAVGLTDAELAAAGLYVVNEIRPTSERTVQLSMSNYDARLYSAD